MTERIKLVQGDTAPQIRLALTDENTNDPIDLTGATVTLHFRSSESGEVVFSRPAIINPDTADTGVCYIQWATGDLNVDAGNYDGEVEVVNGAGLRQTVYDLLKFKVREDFA
jgi:hypothetical protein